MLPEEVALLGLDTFETINAALISNKNLVSGFVKPPPPKKKNMRYKQMEIFH